VASGGLTDAGNSFIMESLDGGQRWRPINAGNTTGSMQWFGNDPQDPDLLWIVWSRSLSRMVRRKSDEPVLTKTVMPDDPPLPDVLMAAYQYTGVDVGRQMQYRRRAALRALMPRLNASWTSVRSNNYRLLRDVLFPAFPFRFDRWNYSHRDDFRITVTWDLSDLVFNLDVTNFGRIDRLTYDVRENMLRVNVHRMYGELRRLRVLMANEPPADLRVRLMYKARMEALAAYINLVTGNYLTYWWQGNRQRGWKTKPGKFWTKSPGPMPER
jgi:hypothetical protein